MKTPLPEPQIEYWSGHREPFVFYDADQMREYGAAEYARAIEDAAKLLEKIENRCIAKDVDDPPLNHVIQAVRKIGKENEKVEVPTAAD